MAALNQNFKFLPTPKKNNTIEIILKELQENIKKLNSSEEIKQYQLALSSIIIDKLTNGDWTEKDYFSFYQSINQGVIESFPGYSLSAIIKIFSYTENELKAALEKIKENTKNLEFPFYPYRKLVTTEDKKQVLQILDYDKMDAFRMIIILLAKMSMHQTSEVKKLFAEQERTITIELLTEIIDGKREDTAFLSGFDKEFGYLNKIDVFKELYLSYRKDYIRQLRKNFMYRCQQESIQHQNAENSYKVKKFSDIKYRRTKPRIGGYYKSIKEK